MMGLLPQTTVSNVLRFFCFLYFLWTLSSSHIFTTPLHEVRTDYLKWSSTLPAFSVCAVPPRRNSSRMEGFLENLVRPGNTYCFRCSNTTNYPTNGYRTIAKMRGHGCRHLFQDCNWNGRRLDCCVVFKKLATSEGGCFSINSQLTGSRYLLEVSHYAKQGEIYFSTTEDVQVYIHDPKDLAETGSPSFLMKDGERLEVLFGFHETVTEDSANMVHLETRGCVLPKEFPGYSVYSQSLCRIRCIGQEQMSVCGCVHHLLSVNVDAPDCNLTGLICLDKNIGKKTEKKLKKMCQHCLPSCEQTDVHIVWKNLSRIQKGSRQIKFSIINPPYEKGVIRSRYDLVDAVVFVACLSRLFTSASLYNFWNMWRVRNRLKYEQLHQYDSILL